MFNAMSLVFKMHFKIIYAEENAIKEFNEF